MNDAQRKASEENFALFILQGMYRNLLSIDKVLDSTILLRREIEYCIDQVNLKQRERILKAKKDKLDWNKELKIIITKE